MPCDDRSPAHEGIETYLAESRLPDTSNKYHLWAFTEPNYRIPLGIQGRDVVDTKAGLQPRYRQRRL